MQLDQSPRRRFEAEIVPFPVRNRVGVIRRTASNIFNSRTTREAEALWRRSVEGLRRQMQKIGVPDDWIETELRTFHDCVDVEMQRLAYVERSRPGGDAA